MEYGWCFCISVVDFTVCTALNRHMSTYNHQGETNVLAMDLKAVRLHLDFKQHQLQNEQTEGALEFLEEKTKSQ